MDTPMEEDGAQEGHREKGGPATAFSPLEGDPEEMEPDLSQLKIEGMFINHSWV